MSSLNLKRPFVPEDDAEEVAARPRSLAASTTEIRLLAALDSLDGCKPDVESDYAVTTRAYLKLQKSPPNFAAKITTKEGGSDLCARHAPDTGGCGAAQGRSKTRFRRSARESGSAH